MDCTQKAIVETLIQHASQISDHERTEGNEAASQTLLRMGQWMQHMKDQLAAVTTERDALREVTDKLLKMSDGTPAAPGDVMWCPDVRRSNGELVELVYRSGHRPAIRRKADIQNGVRSYATVGKCYPTKDAALARGEGVRDGT